MKKSWGMSKLDLDKLEQICMKAIEIKPRNPYDGSIDEALDKIPLLIKMVRELEDKLNRVDQFVLNGVRDE